LADELAGGGAELVDDVGVVVVEEGIVEGGGGEGAEE
jgi:hypothetical protein